MGGVAPRKGTDPAPDEIGHVAVVMPGVCAGSSRLSEAGVKEKLVQKPVDGVNVLALRRPESPERCVLDQRPGWLARVELCRDAVQQIVDLRPVPPPPWNHVSRTSSPVTAAASPMRLAAVRERCLSRLEV